MVVIETPDGTKIKYCLEPSPSGLRLVHRHASYDLVTMVQSGWRILGIDSDADRSHLKGFFRLLQRTDVLRELSDAMGRLPEDLSGMGAPEAIAYRCPSCGSDNVNSTMRTIESTYCRCRVCGNISEAERGEPAHSHGHYRRRTDVA